MKVSTRGRYALRVMIDLAEHWEGDLIPMKDVASRQGISLKYIERILPALSKGDLIQGVHGRGGGYKLTRKPEEYTVLEILELAEGDMAPVACLKEGAETCPRAEICKTLPMWKKFQEMMKTFFGGITLDELMHSPEEIDRLIEIQALCGMDTGEGRE